MRILCGLIILFGVVFTAGCQPSSLGTETPVVSSPGTTVFIPPNDAPTQTVETPEKMDKTMPKLPERVPPTQAITPVTGEVPTSLLDSILKDLAERTGAAAEHIVVIQAQSTVWNDGSMGCPQPGVLYTQALVNGYWVLLEVDGKQYDYRAGKSGTFILCENGSIPRLAPGTPAS